MKPEWLEDYFRLVLQVEVALHSVGEDNFIDYYLGPSRLRPPHGATPPIFASLGGAVHPLRAALPDQDLSASRHIYLDRQLQSLEMLCQVYTQDTPDLQAASAVILDVIPQPVPETQLERARQLYDQALPGSGSLAERFSDFSTAVTLPPTQLDQLVSMVPQLLADLRARVSAHVELPPGDTVEVKGVRGVPYGAANYYLGGFRSRFELNLDRPANLFTLLYQLCHEVYPGHHTEFCLKDWHLVQQRGWGEHQVFFISPQLVFTEGLATIACEMLFTPQEAADWLEAQLFRPLGIHLEDYDLVSLWQAANLVHADEISANLMLQRWAGATDRQLIDYTIAYLPYPPALVQAFLSGMQTPLRQIYALSYAQGRRLLANALSSPPRWDIFRRALVEPLTPGMVV